MMERDCCDHSRRQMIQSLFCGSIMLPAVFSHLLSQEARGEENPLASCERRCEKTAGNMMEPQNSDWIICLREWSQQSLSIILSFIFPNHSTYRNSSLPNTTR